MKETRIVDVGDGHCCFEASVVDREGVILCETFDIEDAKMIAEVLNNMKEKE